MREKREIHALDYAVCEFITHLDAMFAGVVDGWQLNVSGLNLEVEPGPIPSQVRVFIRPVGWPKGSQIMLRMVRQWYSPDFGSWAPFEGVIVAPHINGFGWQLRIKIESTYPSIYTIRLASMPLPLTEESDAVLTAFHRKAAL